MLARLRPTLFPFRETDPMAVPKDVSDTLDQAEAAAAELVAEVLDLRSRVTTGLTEADVGHLRYRLATLAAKLKGTSPPPELAA